MLILKITQNRVKKKKIFLKHIKEDSVKRENIFVGNKLHTLVECSEEFLTSDEFKRLLNVYKGKILVPENEKAKKLCKDYIFNTKPYLKRAVLSALSNHIKESSYNNNTLCIVDDAFVFSQEYLELVKNIRNLIVVSEINIEAQKFMDYCFLNFGVVVRFKKDFRGLDWDYYVDLTDVFDDGRVFIRYKDGEGVLHPDKTYFVCKKEYEEILSWGISSVDLCAAVDETKDVAWL